MEKHGEYFPEGPKNVDELIDTLDKQIQEMQLDMVTTLKFLKALGEEIGTVCNDLEEARLR